MRVKVRAIWHFKFNHLETYPRKRFGNGTIFLHYPLHPDDTKDHGSQAHRRHVQIYPLRETLPIKNCRMSLLHHPQQEEHHSYICLLISIWPISYFQHSLCASLTAQIHANQQHRHGQKTISEAFLYKASWSLMLYVWIYSSTDKVAATSSSKKV